MALAHIERHIELLTDLGFFMRVDARNETVSAGVEVEINLRAHRLDDLDGGRRGLVGIGERRDVLSR